jgi:pyridoxal phosphate enzyme (YggS family)
MNTVLAQRLELIQSQIGDSCRSAGRNPGSVRLIAVTKTHPVSVIQELIELGIRDIGENRVQEIASKIPLLNGNFEVHMIGHLQTNKVAAVLPLINWIHSIDRIRLIEKIEQYHDDGIKIPVLVEVNTSGEISKTGCTPQESRELCERISQSAALQLRGLMTIGPLEGGEKDVRNSFILLRNLSEKIHDLCPSPELSMGMSSDFLWAIEEGSTMVRIGSALIGARNT